LDIRQTLQFRFANLKDNVLIAETKSGELAIVDSKQSDGIVAFKAKAEILQQRLKIMSAIIDTLKTRYLKHISRL
jgi:hypothetical protein